MIPFWSIPRISRDDIIRQQKATKNLARARTLNVRAAEVSAVHKRIREDNHFIQAIFGGRRQ